MASSPSASLGDSRQVTPWALTQSPRFQPGSTDHGQLSSPLGPARRCAVFGYTLHARTTCQMSPSVPCTAVAQAWRQSYTKLQADCADFETGSHYAVEAILELTM